MSDSLESEPQTVIPSSCSLRNSSDCSDHAEQVWASDVLLSRESSVKVSSASLGDPVSVEEERENDGWEEVAMVGDKDVAAALVEKQLLDGCAGSSGEGSKHRGSEELSNDRLSDMTHDMHSFSSITGCCTSTDTDLSTQSQQLSSVSSTSAALSSGDLPSSLVSSSSLTAGVTEDSQHVSTTCITTGHMASQQERRGGMEEGLRRRVTSTEAESVVSGPEGYLTQLTAHLEECTEVVRMRYLQYLPSTLRRLAGRDQRTNQQNAATPAGYPGDSRTVDLAELDSTGGRAFGSGAEGLGTREVGVVEQHGRDDGTHVGGGVGTLGGLRGMVAGLRERTQLVHTMFHNIAAGLAQGGVFGNGGFAVQFGQMGLGQMGGVETAIALCSGMVCLMMTMLMLIFGVLCMLIMTAVLLQMPLYVLHSALSSTGALLNGRPLTSLGEAVAGSRPLSNSPHSGLHEGTWGGAESHRSRGWLDDIMREGMWLLFGEEREVEEQEEEASKVEGAMEQGEGDEEAVGGQQDNKTVSGEKIDHEADSIDSRYVGVGHRRLSRSIVDWMLLPIRVPLWLLGIDFATTKIPVMQYDTGPGLQEEEPWITQDGLKAFVIGGGWRNQGNVMLGTDRTRWTCGKGYSLSLVSSTVGLQDEGAVFECLPVVHEDRGQVDPIYGVFAGRNDTSAGRGTGGTCHKGQTSGDFSNPDVMRENGIDISRSEDSSAQRDDALYDKLSSTMPSRLGVCESSLRHSRDRLSQAENSHARSVRWVISDVWLKRDNDYRPGELMSRRVAVGGLPPLFLRFYPNGMFSAKVSEQTAEMLRNLFKSKSNRYRDGEAGAYRVFSDGFIRAFIGDDQRPCPQQTCQRRFFDNNMFARMNAATIEIQLPDLPGVVKSVKLYVKVGEFSHSVLVEADRISYSDSNSQDGSNKEAKSRNNSMNQISHFPAYSISFILGEESRGSGVGSLAEGVAKSFVNLSNQYAAILGLNLDEVFGGKKESMNFEVILGIDDAQSSALKTYRNSLVKRTEEIVIYD
eukprot:GHVQ01012661.1.p1 GENE.GHVQ01012661.1~~GHVQ01012661.1.p1  ORF type:complete len:1024 (+),score=169.27 GHVQ01012661.1:329-3400(+)